MLAMRLHDEAKSICVMLVLEPGNLEKLKEGKPIHKWLNEFIPELPAKVELLFAYSPDLPWVVGEMRRRGIHPGGGDAMEMAFILEESLKRTPVVVRDRSAEEMKKEL